MSDVKDRALRRGEQRVCVLKPIWRVIRILLMAACAAAPAMPPPPPPPPTHTEQREAGSKELKDR